MENLKILVPSQGLDQITRETIAHINKTHDIDITVAGPGEELRGGIEAPAIKSKISPSAIRAYRTIVRTHDIKLTFSISTSALSTMLWATLGLKVRNMGYRGTQAKVRKSDPFNWLALLNPRVSHVVCETPDIEETLSARIGAGKVSGMPKPYELSWAEDAIRNPAALPVVAPGTTRLIYVGVSKGRPHKGLRYLLDAMAMVQSGNVALTVVGEADQSDMKNAPDNVAFLGNKPDALHYIPGHDIFVLPSLRDASPRVLREAQACGVPCIVSDIPGARSLIDRDKTGILVEPANARALADAIDSLVVDSGKLRYLASNTKEYIAKNYSMDKYAEYLYRTFLKVAKE